MRQPIQRQLLWPMLLVVVLGSATTAILSAWMGLRSLRQAEEIRIGHLATTLTDAGFPLTESVLQRMSSLSGADFVTLTESGNVQYASRSLTSSDGRRLAALPVSLTVGLPSGHRPLELSTGLYRAVRIPVRTASAAKPISLVILTSQRRWNELAWQAAVPPLLAGALAAGGAALLALSLSQKFVYRIRELAHRAEILAEGKFESLPLPPIDDELRDFAAAFNSAAEKLDRYEKQVRAGERLQTLGRLGAGMAHQLRNAMTGARMALDFHTAELPSNAERESLSVAVQQLTLMESYLQRFLTLSRGQAPAMRDVDLAALVSETLPLVEPICRHHQIAVAWVPPSVPVSLTGDAESLRQMLLNLLMNAVEAVQAIPASERRLGIELSPAPDGVVVIRVWDHGPGPSAEIAANLLERFVTDKPDGTGLGLAVAQEIAQAHGGTIRWGRAGGRTCFDVLLSKTLAKPEASGEASATLVTEAVVPGTMTTNVRQN